MGSNPRTSELRDRMFKPMSAAACRVVSNSVGGFAGPETPYRADYLARGGELVHYLVGARFGGLLEARGIEAGAQDQHCRAGTGPAQIRDQVHPVAVGKSKVQDRYVEAHQRGLVASLDERS